MVYSWVADSKNLDVVYAKIRHDELSQSPSIVPTYPTTQRRKEAAHSLQITEAVLDKLEDWTGFEDLHERIRSNLAHGLLKFAREVEIMLTFDADPRSPRGVNYRLRRELPSSPWTQYKDYCQKVTFLCDAFMSPIGPNWRDKHYATELDGILANYLKSKKGQSCNPRVVLNSGDCRNSPSSCPAESGAFSFSSSSLSFGQTDLTMIGSPSASPPNPSELPADTRYEFASHTISELPADVFYELPVHTAHELPGDAFGELPVASARELPTHAAYDLPDYYLPDSTTQELSGLYTCELPAHTAHEPPTASLPPQPNNDAPLACEVCGMQMHSNHRDRAANLRRHQRTVCCRNDQYFCQEPGCNEVFPRPDYLKAHEKGEHKPKDPRASKRTRRRKTDTVHDLTSKTQSTSAATAIVPNTNFF